MHNPSSIKERHRTVDVFTTKAATDLIQVQFTYDRINDWILSYDSDCIEPYDPILRISEENTVTLPELF